MVIPEFSIIQAFRAVKDDDKDALVTILKQYPSVRNATNPEGISLFMFAIYNGKKDIAGILVNAGAKLDVFSASAYGALNEIVEILRIEPGLLNSFSQDGWTPLHL